MYAIYHLRTLHCTRIIINTVLLPVRPYLFFRCLVFLCIIVCLHSIITIKGSPDSNGSGNSGSGFPMNRGQLVSAHAGCSTRPLIADTECYAESEERSTASAASGTPSSSSHESFRRTQGAAFAIVPDTSPGSGSVSLAPTSSSARRRTRPTPAAAAGDEYRRENEQEEEEEEEEEEQEGGSPDALTERALDDFAAHFLPNSSSSSSESFTELNTDEPFRYNCSTRM